MIVARTVPVMIVLGWATLASAAGGAAFQADLAWEEARGNGDVVVAGAAWAWNIRPPLGAVDDPDLGGAFLVVEGARMVLREEYIDYKAVYGAKVNPDAEPERKETTIDSGSLSLAGARATMNMLGASLAEDGALVPFTVKISAESLGLAPLPEFSASLFESNAGTGDGEDASLDRSVERAGQTLGVAPAAGSQLFEISGDFSLHLWDADLKDRDGNVFVSGVTHSNDPGAGTPADGFVADARNQVLTVIVTGGRMTMLVPERHPTFFLDPAQSSVSGQGSWDLLGADGAMEWGGGAAQVAEEAVRIVGDLHATFSASSAGKIASTWSGSAREVSAGAEPLTLATVDAPSPSQDRYLFWGIPLGVALLGAGGGAFVVLHRRGAPRPGPTQPALAKVPAAAPAALADDHEAMLAAAVEKLQSGHAAEVVADLEASFDKEHEAAPFQAYVLALAHLQRKDVEAAADWFLVAARLYPNFAKELPINDSLKVLRAHPRVRAELGLVEDSVAYV